MSGDDRIVAPFGAWRSPLDPAGAAAGGVRFDRVEIATRPDGEVTVRWQESRPAEGGRGVVCEWRGRPGEPGDAGSTELTGRDRSVRSGVNEYGGGSWWSGPDGACFVVDASTQQVLRIGPDGATRPVTQVPVTGGVDRHAAGVVVPGGRWMVVERERIVPVVGTSLHELVALPVDEPVAVGGLPIVDGADFVAAPTVSPDGRALAWLRWDHPDMPWDAAELWAGELLDHGDELEVVAARRVAGGRPTGSPRPVSVCLPEFDPDGVLWWCDDRDDWWHLRRAPVAGVPEEGVGDTVDLVWDREEEVGEPRWTSGGRRVGWCDDGRVVFAAAAGGRHTVSVATPGADPIRLPGIDATHVEHLAVAGRHVAMVAGDGVRPTTVWLVDVDGGVALDLRGVAPLLDPADVSVPEPITFPTTDGEVAHGLFHAPTSATHRGPDGALPPLVVRIHGGPTAAARAEFSPSVQFWTTRGIAVVEVDYRGSTGYGRRYRDLLRGQWGVVDVEDCRAAAGWLAEQGRVAADACVIRGGSAGGFTALSALVADGRATRAGGEPVFAAACTLYGVTDLAALAADTHEFESRYLDGLVGVWPEEAAVYAARSPAAHVELIDAPVLILQGGEDPVVPVAQAHDLRDALAARGVPHACVVFPGEAHGFRRAANVVRALELELACYGEVLGFVPAGQAPSTVLARSTAVAPERPET